MLDDSYVKAMSSRIFLLAGFPPHGGTFLSPP